MEPSWLTVKYCHANGMLAPASKCEFLFLFSNWESVNKIIWFCQKPPDHWSIGAFDFLVLVWPHCVRNVNIWLDTRLLWEWTLIWSIRFFFCYITCVTMYSGVEECEELWNCCMWTSPACVWWALCDVEQWCSDSGNMEGEWSTISCSCIPLLLAWRGQHWSSWVLKWTSVHEGSHEA